MSDPIELAPDYYLHNFTKLITHALDWYPDLLTESELNWLHRFKQLNKSSQCLLVRLLSRKGEWFRSDKLDYPEIGDITPCLESLKLGDFITVNHDVCALTLASELLTKPELCSLFVFSNKTARKELLLSQIEQKPFTQFDSINFVVIRLSHAEVINVLLALFFANTHQDLSQFVLDDLGLHQFESYLLSDQRRFFSTRAELNQLLHLTDLHARYIDSDRKDAFSLLSLLSEIEHPLRHYYLERKRQHLINDMARDLERLGKLEECLEWFAKTSLPPSRERQARVYDKLDSIHDMSDVVTKMSLQPVNVAELETAYKLEQRLKRKQGLRVPREKKPNIHEYHLELDLSQQRVELAVKSHFEQIGYQVFYAENLLLNGLFGLAFWDVVFAPIEGAFINRYQHRPLDLYHADFAIKRQTLVDQVFHILERDGVNSLLSTYHQKHGLANPFIHWAGFELELLEACIKHIPNHVAISLFKVMLKDIKLYRSGMPDLILFKQGQFEWVEVKGPGDKLQDNQWRWFKHFIELEIPFAACYVSQE
ncbi:VRR-NUC domain-containing protein [Vibrio europaeus]|uniref:VRR-NUC domain-containing protein n=1 Tax=Vibrio europaeus TaxID=300876 RepID=UPI00233E7CEE|nr:VRR-NUC domain-containing protein [Vibrio europaeus]MDC5818308.1 VRR-NUC domain-containing protein [Vibrio europaeus]MDC5871690.1 VRR-NUC domain-containing protein [Vibrio europaeus]